MGEHPVQRSAARAARIRCTARHSLGSCMRRVMARCRRGRRAIRNVVGRQGGFECSTDGCARGSRLIVGSAGRCRLRRPFVERVRSSRARHRGGWSERLRPPRVFRRAAEWTRDILRSFDGQCKDISCACSGCVRAESVEGERSVERRPRGSCVRGPQRGSVQHWSGAVSYNGAHIRAADNGVRGERHRPATGRSLVRRLDSGLVERVLTQSGDQCDKAALSLGNVEIAMHKDIVSGEVTG